MRSRRTASSTNSPQQFTASRSIRTLRTNSALVRAKTVEIFKLFRCAIAMNFVYSVYYTGPGCMFINMRERVYSWTITWFGE